MSRAARRLRLPLAALLLAATPGAPQAQPQTASPPAAQQQPAAPAPRPQPPTPAAKSEPVKPPENLEPIGPNEATSILGKSVEGAAGENLGRVVDILVDADGQPRAAVIDFGGFLGVGSRKIAVAWRLLQFRPTDSKAPIRLGVTRAEIQAAPEYKEKIQPAQVVAPPNETPVPPIAPK
ncbi:MAG TPA: PRC-barrel domain-containing protein [Candidatus Sulfotelmatobacter sp.]|nr:PRC-barrel domain-containing protein [Candidatus Sulfotelmatobacter sp.]